MPTQPGQPHVHRRRTLLSEPKPKPCPRCYQPMRPVGNHYECPTHGKAANAP